MSDGRDARGATDGTCRGTRADGTPCRARALPGRPYCWAHDDATREKREQAYAQGGANKATAARLQRLLPRDLKPILALLIAAMKEVHEGVITPAQASSMASCAGAIAKMYELVELEERLRALEEQNGSEAS